MKKIVILILVASTLISCVSSKKYRVSQQKVFNLTTKVNNLENKVQDLEQQIKTNKGKRVIQLPTGAPTTIQQRVENNTLSKEERAYATSVAKYKSGDISAAINSFLEFNKSFPNSKNHTKSLYNIGQAAYSQRDYQIAEKALEELIYQNPLDDSVSSGAATSLLKKVYNATGSNDKILELNSFINNL